MDQLLCSGFEVASHDTTQIPNHDTPLSHLHIFHAGIGPDNIEGRGWPATRIQSRRVRQSPGCGAILIDKAPTHFAADVMYYMARTPMSPQSLGASRPECWSRTVPQKVARPVSTIKGTVQRDLALVGFGTAGSAASLVRSDELGR